MTDNSTIAVALLLLADNELEKARHDAREHLEIINSMSEVSRCFGTLFDVVFPSDPKAKLVSEFFQQLAIEIEKDRP